MYFILLYDNGVPAYFARQNYFSGHTHDHTRGLDKLKKGYQIGPERKLSSCAIANDPTNTPEDKCIKLL